MLINLLNSLLFAISKLCDKIDKFRKAYKKIMWGVIISIIFGIILFLNILTPMLADDFGYLYIFGEKEQVGSLSDLIQSQINHYQLWGGRSVVHFIGQALLQAPRFLADVLNSLVYLLFISLIYLHIRGRRGRNSLSIFILINLAVWFIVPMFGDTILWITGSANYLWGTTLILLFLLPYRFYEGRSTPSGIFPMLINSAAMLLLGIIAGWTNENTVGGMIVLIILLFVYYRSQKWNDSTPLIIGLLGVIIGYGLMIAAPGNFVRSGETFSLNLYVICYRLFIYTQTLFLQYGIFIVFYLTLLVLYYKYKKQLEQAHMPVSIIYIIGAMAAIYVMIFSPQFPARAWFGLVVFMLIGLGILLSQLIHTISYLKHFVWILIAVGSISFLFSFTLAVKDIYRAFEMDKERELIAKEARERGDRECYFKRFVPHTNYVHGEDEEGSFLLSYYYGIFIEYEEE